MRIVNFVLFLDNFMKCGKRIVLYLCTAIQNLLRYNEKDNDSITGNIGHDGQCAEGRRER